MDGALGVRLGSAYKFGRGFTGYHLDQETGLYYARERMYSSALGVFVNRDPWKANFDGMTPSALDGYPDGLSLYRAYFAPNGVDPYGTDWLDCTVQCMEQEDPLNAVWEKFLLTAAGGTFPKTWVASMARAAGDEQLARQILGSMREGASRVTTIPSSIQAWMRSQGASAGLRSVGRAASPFFVAYGLVLAQIEIQCASYCVCLDSYVKPPGIRFSIVDWAAEQANGIINALAGD
jgi:RHS repeat-associated protein